MSRKVSWPMRSVIWSGPNTGTKARSVVWTIESSSSGSTAPMSTRCSISRSIANHTRFQRKPGISLLHANRSQADVVAEAHRRGDRLVARPLSGDDLDEDDQLRLHRMDDDGSLRVGHARGEPRHRKVGCRAPQERIGADRRLDVPVAGRLHLGVLDDRLHHGGAGRQRAWRGRRVSRPGPGPRRRPRAPRRRSRPAWTRSGATGHATCAPTRRVTTRVPRSRPGRTAVRTDGRCSPRRRGRPDRPAFDVAPTRLSRSAPPAPGAPTATRRGPGAWSRPPGRPSPGRRSDRRWP